MICGLCNATIPKGADCVPQSFGLDSQPKRPWEDAFLGEAPGKIDGTIKVVEFEAKGDQK